MQCKKYLFLLLLLGAGIHLGFAQGAAVTRGAKLSARSARQAAALPKKVGRAALSNPEHRDFLRQTERLSQLLDRKIHQQVIKTKGHLAGGLYPNTAGGFKKLATNMPGFEPNWPAALEAYAKRHNGADFFDDIQAQIAALYPNARFSAAFVASFDEVLLLERAVRMPSVPLKEALENGLDKLSALNMPGYAAVMVDNGSHNLRDILILDIKKERVISLHQSQGRALARLAAKRRQAWREKHPQLAARLDKQGFALDAKRVMITKDGITWAPLPHGEIRRNLVYAWEWGWYAKFKHGSWQVEGFAEKKGEPLQPQVPALKVVF